MAVSYISGRLLTGWMRWRPGAEDCEKEEGVDSEDEDKGTRGIVEDMAEEKSSWDNHLSECGR